MSSFLLPQGARTIPIGTACAVRTGIGAVGAAVLGMILFDEPRGLLRVACIGLGAVEAIGRKLVSGR